MIRYCVLAIAIEKEIGFCSTQDLIKRWNDVRYRLRANDAYPLLLYIKEKEIIYIHGRFSLIRFFSTVETCAFR